jgi:hypothetical protein
VLGLKPGELKDGANIMSLDRIPHVEEFKLRGYSNTPAGEIYRGGAYPPGMGAPQWELTREIPATQIRALTSDVPY